MLNIVPQIVKYLSNIYEDFKGVEKYEEFKEITAEEYQRIAKRMLKLCNSIDDQSK
nr:hypothetical protein [uncultured Capnocytophaga sp.]